jgi:hypothetical protein
VKIGIRKRESKRAQCPKCGEHNLQAVYMIINRKQVKIGEGCPVCLPKMLEKKEEETE